jgi:hypothetical protein
MDKVQKLNSNDMKIGMSFDKSGYNLENRGYLMLANQWLDTVMIIKHELNSAIWNFPQPCVFLLSHI